MSLKGEINKYSGDIRRMVSQMSRQGITGIDGAVRGTKKIIGYVCAIHEEGELAGTVDVQEFNYEPDEYPIKGTGHHKGVLLSAIQDNPQGVLIVPVLYSEVVIVQSPTDGCEYVIMYSHAKRIQLLAQSFKGEDDGMVELGVTETEKPVVTDDGLEKDYNELEPTKNKSNTKYTATSIIDQITSPKDKEGLRQEKTVEHKIITIGNTKITIDGENVCIETNSCEIKGKTVTITGGTLKTKGVAATDLNGPFNAIKVCPFSGAPHCGSSVSGT